MKTLRLILRLDVIWGLLFGLAPAIFVFPMLDVEHHDRLAEITKHCIAIAICGAGGLVIGVLVEAKRRKTKQPPAADHTASPPVRPTPTTGPVPQRSPSDAHSSRGV